MKKETYLNLFLTFTHKDHYYFFIKLGTKFVKNKNK